MGMRFVMGRGGWIAIDAYYCTYPYCTLPPKGNLLL